MYGSKTRAEVIALDNPYPVDMWGQIKDTASSIAGSIADTISRPFQKMYQNFAERQLERFVDGYNRLNPDGTIGASAAAVMENIDSIVAFYTDAENTRANIKKSRLQALNPLYPYRMNFHKQREIALGLKELRDAYGEHSTLSSVETADIIGHSRSKQATAALKQYAVGAGIAQAETVSDLAETGEHKVLGLSVYGADAKYQGTEGAAANAWKRNLTRSSEINAFAFDGLAVTAGAGYIASRLGIRATLGGVSYATDSDFANVAAGAAMTLGATVAVSYVQNRMKSKALEAELSGDIKKSSRLQLGSEILGIGLAGYFMGSIGGNAFAQDSEPLTDTSAIADTGAKPIVSQAVTDLTATTAEPTATITIDVPTTASDAEPTPSTDDSIRYDPETRTVTNITAESPAVQNLTPPATDTAVIGSASMDTSDTSSGLSRPVIDTVVVADKATTPVIETQSFETSPAYAGVSIVADIVQTPQVEGPVSSETVVPADAAVASQAPLTSGSDMDPDIERLISKTWTRDETSMRIGFDTKDPDLYNGIWKYGADSHSIEIQLTENLNAETDLVRILWDSDGDKRVDTSAFLLRTDDGKYVYSNDSVDFSSTCFQIGAVRGEDLEFMHGGKLRMEFDYIASIKHGSCLPGYTRPVLPESAETIVVTPEAPAEDTAIAVTPEAPAEDTAIAVTPEVPAESSAIAVTPEAPAENTAIAQGEPEKLVIKFEEPQNIIPEPIVPVKPAIEYNPNLIPGDNIQFITSEENAVLTLETPGVKGDYQILHVRELQQATVMANAGLEAAIADGHKYHSTSEDLSTFFEMDGNKLVQVTPFKDAPAQGLDHLTHVYDIAIRVDHENRYDTLHLLVEVGDKAKEMDSLVDKDRGWWHGSVWPKGKDFESPDYVQIRHNDLLTFRSESVDEFRLFEFNSDYNSMESSVLEEATLIKDGKHLDAIVGEPEKGVEPYCDELAGHKIQFKFDKVRPGESVAGDHPNEYVMMGYDYDDKGNVIDISRVGVGVGRQSHELAAFLAGMGLGWMGGHYWDDWFPVGGENAPGRGGGPGDPRGGGGGQ
ncbi:hypothetical protein JW968_03295 [Candidatus Woesearchaeota archaeon]|nr:hypothetical protein [Candidatus Woesearchaeota archaeon]